VFGVLIPVGPDPREVTRLEALLGELERHENPQELRVVVVDDGPVPRRLSGSWPGLEVIRTPLWSGVPPDTLSAHVAGTLAGLRAVCDGVGEIEFVVKLDTDAAIIRPFSSALRDALRDPRLGVVGSYDTTADGGVRDWTMWTRTLARADRPFALSRRRGRVRVWRRDRSQRAAVRRLRDAAYRSAPPGAHCLGGAYAVSSSFLSSAELDWCPWIRTRLGEDVVVGLLCSAVGLEMKSLTGPGDPFALSWRGLPLSAPEIAARGHSIVHSVKRESEADELALREALQQNARAVNAAS